jgi:cystathionine beta-lyase
MLENDAEIEAMAPADDDDGKDGGEIAGWQPETFLGHGIGDPHAHGGMVNPPVYRASTVVFRDLADMEARERALRGGADVLWYGRKGTATSFAVAAALSTLEGGYKTLLVSSGLSACASAIQAFVRAGDHILVTDSVYGPTRHFLETVLTRFGVTTSFYAPTIAGAIDAQFRANTRLVYLESPGSQTFEIQDVPAIAAAARQRGAVVVMDNTWASPLYFKPFAHGVNVSVQAATKYIVGHADASMGAITADREHWDAVREQAFATGLTSGGDDLYLAQRGLRTLPLRMERHWRSGERIAAWLATRSEIAAVLHPALPGAPGHELWKRDFLGASGLFGVIFRPCPDAAFRAFVDRLQLFGLGFSWGGFESLKMPIVAQRNAVAPTRPAAGPGLRLHVGLEAVDDLRADLEAGFEAFAKAAGR